MKVWCFCFNLRWLSSKKHKNVPNCICPKFILHLKTNEEKRHLKFLFQGLRPVNSWSSKIIITLYYERAQNCQKKRGKWEKGFYFKWEIWWKWYSSQSPNLHLQLLLLYKSSINVRYLLLVSVWTKHEHTAASGRSESNILVLGNW